MKRESGEMVALEQDKYDDLKHEYDVLRSLSSIHVVKALNLIQGTTFSYLAMPLAMSSVQVFLDKLVTPSSVPEKLIMQLAKQILQGLHHVHESHVIHRDLKPANMLLVSAQHGVNDEVKISIGSCPFLLQLADFGNAGLVTAAQTGGPYCTLPYASPEDLVGLRLSCSTDIWSFACCILQMLMLTPLFQHPQALDEVHGRAATLMRIARFLGTPPDVLAQFLDSHAAHTIRTCTPSSGLRWPLLGNHVPEIHERFSTSFPKASWDNLKLLLMPCLAYDPVARPSAGSCWCAYLSKCAPQPESMQVLHEFMGELKGTDVGAHEATDVDETQKLELQDTHEISAVEEAPAIGTKRRRVVGKQVLRPLTLEVVTQWADSVGNHMGSIGVLKGKPAYIDAEGQERKIKSSKEQGYQCALCSRHAKNADAMVKIECLRFPLPDNAEGKQFSLFMTRLKRLHWRKEECYSHFWQNQHLIPVEVKRALGAS